jgi:hypothetical protein
VRPSKKVSPSLKIGGSELGYFPKSIRILALDDSSPPSPEGPGGLLLLPVPSNLLRRAASSSEKICGSTAYLGYQDNHPPRTTVLHLHREVISTGIWEPVTAIQLHMSFAKEYDLQDQSQQHLAVSELQTKSLLRRQGFLTQKWTRPNPASSE